MCHHPMLFLDFEVDCEVHEISHASGPSQGYVDIDELRYGTVDS